MKHLLEQVSLCTKCFEEVKIRKLVARQSGGAASMAALITSVCPACKLAAEKMDERQKRKFFDCENQEDKKKKIEGYKF